MRDNYDAMLRAVIGRCVWSIRVRVHGNFNVARGFVGLMPRKKSSGSYLQRRKIDQRRQKELMTTWESLNYKKSSQQLPSCVVATRDSLFPLFCFEQ